MDRETRTFTRQELYDLVWSKAVQQVAKDLRISDVGLAKILRSLEIPLPPRGYWRRKETGKRVKQKPLKPCPELDGEPITFYIYPPKPVPPPPVYADRLAEFAKREQRPEMKVVVSETLDEPHRLVSKTKSAFRHSRKDQHQALRLLVDHVGLDIRVTESGIDRALRIMDALLKAFEERGYRVRMASEHEGSTTVEVLGYRIRFALRESSRMREVTPKDIEQDSWLQYSKVIYEPTGLFTLSHYTHGGSADANSFKDNKKQRIEDVLNQFIVSLYEEALKAEQWEVARPQREEQERLERQREWEEQQKRIQRQMREAEERRKVEKLLQDSEAWHQSQRVRAYIEAVRSEAVNRNSGFLPPGELSEWLEWAKEQADDLDPLKR